MSRQSLLAVTVVCLFCCFPVGARGENPSKDTETAPLATFTGEDTEKWADDGAKIAESAHRLIDQIQIKAKSKNYKDITLKQCGQLNVLLMELGDTADKLTARGEVAGGELKFRMEIMRQFLSELIPEVQKAHLKEIDKLAEPIAAEAKKYEKANLQEKANQTLAKKDFQAAYDMTWAVVKKLEVYGMWFPSLSTTRKAHVEPYVKLYQTAQGEILTELRGKIKKEYTANRVPLKTEIILAGLEHSAKGGENAGAALAGPKAAAQAIQDWKENQLIALHNIAWDGAQSDLVNAQATIRDLPTMNRDIADRLAKLILSDSTRVPPDQIPATYRAYAQCLAPMWRQASDEKLLEPIDAAMKHLANVNSTFGGQVQAYDRATGDVLRWRQRIAERLGDKAVKGYDELPFNPLGTKTLRAPAAKSIIELRLKVLNKKCRDHDLPRGPNGAATSGLEKDNPFYTRIPEGMEGNLIEITEGLKHDLLMAETEPLSLHGAAALAETIRGDVLRSGGKITNYEIEGLLYRCHEASADDGGLVRLGPFWHDSIIQSSLIDQVILRGELTPDWIQYRYGFTQISQ